METGKDVPRFEQAEASISLGIEKSAKELVGSNRLIIFIGEEHDVPSKFSTDGNRGKAVVEIIKLLDSMGAKPRFLGVDLTTIDYARLNKVGQSYYRGIKSLMEYAKTNDIEVVPVAGDKEFEPGSQEFEDSIKENIVDAEGRYGFGVVFVGRVHARLTKSTGKNKIVPAARVLKNEDEKVVIKSVLLHEVKEGEPGKEKVDGGGKLHSQSSDFVDYYLPKKGIKQVISKFGLPNQSDFDLIVLIPSWMSRLEKAFS